MNSKNLIKRLTEREGDEEFAPGSGYSEKEKAGLDPGIRGDRIESEQVRKALETVGEFNVVQATSFLEGFIHLYDNHEMLGNMDAAGIQQHLNAALKLLSQHTGA
jgi:hypothetical protein